VLAPLQRRLATAHSAPAFVRDQAQIERWLPWLKRVTAYFTPEVHNVRHVPSSGAVLVVGNHSCSFYMPDAWVVAAAVAERRGLSSVYSLVYDLLLAVPGYGPFLRRSGALPADGTAASAALAGGAAVLVFPGGDYDACRPWTDRDVVDFGGRRGFVRLALRTGVPIVPVVSYGAHHGVMVVARGEPVARVLSLPRLRIKVLPLMLVPPFGVVPVVALPPLPAHISVEFLAPMTWPDLPREAADDPAVVARCYDEVMTSMQHVMDRLAADEPHPVTAGITSLAAQASQACLRVLRRSPALSWLSEAPARLRQNTPSRHGSSPRQRQRTGRALPR
jgi:1-acyl-sn-glycerol-3-phosphate acyltransferase